MIENVRFKKLTYNNKVYENSKQIEEFLYTTPYSWLLECELDEVVLEIKNNILYWKSGILYWGTTEWMVWESGEFRSGTWTGGIFFDGIFKGTWENGVFKNGQFKGIKQKGEFPL